MIPGIMASGDAVAFTPAILGYLPGASINESYSVQLTCPGATAWAVTDGALPDGLTLDADTGEVSGIATVEDTFTFELTATTGAGDIVRSFTVGIGHYIALLHMNGTNGGTSFPDETGRTWSQAGDGDATTVTAAEALGGVEGNFTSTNQALTTPDHADFHLSTDDWTIEFFIKLNDDVQSGVFPCVICQRQSILTNHAFTVYMLPTPNQNLMRFVYNNNASQKAGPVLDAGVRHHVAISRRGTRMYFHYDGAPFSAYDFTGVDIIDSTVPVNIGALDTPLLSGTYIDARLDELRFLRGAARYGETDEFDPEEDVVESDYPVV